MNEILMGLLIGTGTAIIGVLLYYLLSDRKKEKFEIRVITQEEIIQGLINDGYQELDYEQFLKLSIIDVGGGHGYSTSYNGYYFSYAECYIYSCEKLRLFFKGDFFERYFNGLDEQSRNEILKNNR